jgi:hypothetical protein
MVAIKNSSRKPLPARLLLEATLPALLFAVFQIPVRVFMFLRESTLLFDLRTSLG